MHFSILLGGQTVGNSSLGEDEAVVNLQQEELDESKKE